jgi:hypothetical protein
MMMAWFQLLELEVKLEVKFGTFFAAALWSAPPVVTGEPLSTVSSPASSG